MAANERIHPLPDVEAPPPLPPGAPLLPSDAIKSEKGDSAALPPPCAYLPPPQRTTPLAYSGPPKRRSSCFCRCMCFLLSLLLLLVVVSSVLVGIFFLVCHPRIPKYSINSVRISDFDLAADASLAATFNVSITAWNPNKMIGIYYEGGSHVSVWYADTELCQGSLPTFYQGHRNTTVMEVSLTGETRNATSLVAAVQEEERQTGIIPLVIKGTVPVKVKVGKVKLMKINVKVKCGLVVDILSAGSNEISISSGRCKIRPHF
ncbi:hypothetical protein Nepgr_012085 [Nepenthes gracilis]|uniref:Late embryogenesis abundant protein LEA-2 subgroup domain-containing protein n=1 Tax=Nepenthes gracilis TaxID=150966 RepID=A0AAD3XMU7_NEPGR|nr:hypothetical protein Nepgr_012085 [Nepenthes gracilis]